MEGVPKAITSSRVRALFDYWSAKRGGRAMPARGDIEPAEIKDLLPYLMIGEVHHAPLRVRLRLVGTGIVDAAKTDLTGQWVDEADLDGNNAQWNEVYQRVVETRAPVFGTTTATVRPGDAHRFDWVVLPLSDDGVTVDRTLEIEDWEMLRRLSKDDVEAAEWSLAPIL